MNYADDTHTGMRTNIVIEEALMSEAMRVTGLPTKKAAVERGLRLLVDHARRAQAFDELEGIGWEGDLDAMRTSRLP